MKCNEFKPSKTCEYCTEYTCMMLGGNTGPLDMCSCMCCANHGIHGDDEVCLISNKMNEAQGNEIMDSRNYDVTNKIFDVLNNTKGFEVAMTKPASGRMLINYKGINFTLTLEPVYGINETKDSQPFDEVVEESSFFLKG